MFTLLFLLAAALAIFHFRAEIKDFLEEVKPDLESIVEGQVDAPPPGHEPPGYVGSDKPASAPAPPEA